MAERLISPSPLDAPPAPPSRAAPVSPTATPTKERPKGTIGVYDRPAHTSGSWSPVTLIALLVGVLVLLWMLGTFKYF
jgi:hypothetical protein